MSATPLATYHVWRARQLELRRPDPPTGGIVELLHWFGRANVNPMIRNRATGFHDWHVQSWRRPRYVLTPSVTHLNFRAGLSSGVWVRVRILPFAAARPLTASARGPVADVLAHHGPATTATITFTTGSIWYLDGTDFRMLMVHGGPYQGPVEIPPGPGLLGIETMQRWAIELPH
jgi:hypothetical protein